MSIASTGLSDHERKQGNANQTATITVSVKAASRISGLGESTIRRFAYQGRLRSTRVGTRRLIFVASLHDLLNEEAPVTAA
jgi:excisionase family DNA binding protein